MITNQIIELISVAIVFGLSAGFSPGPITTLVFTQTLQHNKIEGIKIAFAPLFTDLPIILLSIFIFSKLTQFDTILGSISIIGGLYLCYLGFQSFKTNGFDPDNTTEKSKSLKKGIIANFLSPSPYLFWATIGAPYIFKAYQESLLTAALFLSAFYGFLIGSKVLIAIIVDKSKTFLNMTMYSFIMKALGILLFVFAVIFFYDGIVYIHSQLT